MGVIIRIAAADVHEFHITVAQQLHQPDGLGEVSLSVILWVDTPPVRIGDSIICIHTHSNIDCFGQFFSNFPDNID